MALSCITWLGLDKGDAWREAHNLSKLYPKHSTLLSIDKIMHSKSIFVNVIIVGHDDDVLKLSGPQATSIRGCVSNVVLAACSLAPSKYEGPLQDSNLLSPAQQLANIFNFSVTACTRFLTFDEVGKGHAFIPSDIFGCIFPVNPPASPGTLPLWAHFNKQNDIDELTSRIALI